MASRTINTILNLKDNFSKTVSKTTANTKQFQRQIKQAENQAKRMRKAVTGAFSSVAFKIGGAIATLGIANFAKDSLMLASNLNEVQNVVDTTFGSMSSKINEFAKSAGKQFGMSELQAKKFSGTLGAMMKSSGISGEKLTKMSTDLAGLAGDFASFYNLEPEEAFEKIKSAMVGSTEPMLALGINMSVASMEAYALSKGIKKAWKDMSEAEKQTLRYNYLLEKSKDAQGDYAKTNTGFANALRTLTIKIKDMGAKIMAYAIPPLEELFGKWIAFMDGVDIDEIMGKLINLGKQGFEYLGDAVSWVKDNMNWLLPVASGLLGTFVAFSVITKVVALFSAVKAAVEGVTLAQFLLNAVMAVNPFVWIAIGIGVLIAAAVALWKNWDTVSQFLINSWDWIKKAYAEGVNWVIGKINWLIEKLNKLPGINIPMIAEVGYRTSKDDAHYNLSAAKSMNMEGYADGGIATKPSIFGEAGPEIAIPLKKTPRSMDLLNQASNALGAGQSINVYVTVQGNVIGNQEFIDQVGNTIASKVSLALANM